MRRPLNRLRESEPLVVCSGLARRAAADGPALIQIASNDAI
jgi:hypothetical protein